ncbi:MAG: LysR family transcriptional regulator [Rhizobiaceae bacterium]|nr:LysR family transcriptional regulator [Rhizobiaceae bacterium]
MIHNKASLGDFRAVQALARRGSFRLAAEDIGASPSALSRQITALETRLEVRLFDRDTRNVELTASGHILAGIAERMMHAVEDGMAEFEAHRTAKHGRLAIAGLPSVTAGLLPNLLRSFSATHPDIDLFIIDALSGAVLDAVESGAADIGFTAGTVSARSRLSFQPLMDDEFVAIGAPNGPLAEDRAYGWAELVDMPFIAMAEGTSVRELTDNACLRMGLAFNPRFEVSHLATAGALVAVELGITVLPSLTLPVLQTESLIQRPIKDLGIARRIGLVWRSGRSLSPAAQAFMTHLRQRL